MGLFGVKGLLPHFFARVQSIIPNPPYPPSPREGGILVVAHFVRFLWGFAPRRRKVRSCSGRSASAHPSHHSLAPPFRQKGTQKSPVPFSAKRHAKVACSVVNALTTALFCYHLFAVLRAGARYFCGASPHTLLRGASPLKTPVVFLLWVQAVVPPIQ